MLLRKIKKLINIVINKIKLIVKEKIPNFIDYHILFYWHRREYEKKGIEEIKPFAYKSWHLGYRYYTGTYKEKKVFIKYNKRVGWIKNEIDNINFLHNNEKLAHHIPNLYLGECKENYGYLCEDFLECKSLKNSKNFDNSEIFEQFFEIIEEMQKEKFMHLDINSDNIYIKENEVFIIDFGFSYIMDNTNIKYIGKQKDINLIIKNLNSATKLEDGVIDDAYSFLCVAKEIEPNLISEDYEIWKKFNYYTNKFVFDYRSLNVKD